MSGFHIYESTSEDGFAHADSSGENTPVIARIPDLESGYYADESDHLSTTVGKNSRRLSMPKLAMAATVAVTVLIAGWIIFGGADHLDQESWQQTPPAASAPEAPLWDANDESKTAAIKLDEVIPLRPADTTPSTTIPPTDLEETPYNPYANTTNEKTLQTAAKPAATDIRPSVAANRLLVIATPVPPANPIAADRDWSTLSDGEYYWAVRRRSVATTNVRGLQQGNDMADNQAKPQKPAPTARLGGVIETPTVRVY